MQTNPILKLKELEAWSISISQENDKLRRQLKPLQAYEAKQDLEIGRRVKDSRSFQVQYSRTSQELVKAQEDMQLLEGESIHNLLSSIQSLEAKLKAQNLKYQRLKQTEELERERLLRELREVQKLTNAKEKRIQDLETRTQRQLDDMQAIVTRVQTNEAQLLTTNQQYFEELTRKNTKVEDLESQVRSYRDHIALFQESIRNKEDQVNYLKASTQGKEVESRHYQEELQGLKVYLKSIREEEVKEKLKEHPDARSFLML